MDSISDIDQWVVLVVDDQDECREIAVDALEYHGIRTHQATNGHEAILLMNSITPTMVLTELTMPVLDGWMLRKGMQYFAHLSDVPVVALTAPSLELDREYLLSAGFAGYLTKPFSSRTLITDLATLAQPLA